MINRILAPNVINERGFYGKTRFSGRTTNHYEKAPSLWEQSVGNSTSGNGFSTKVSGVWTERYGGKEGSGKRMQGFCQMKEGW
jgi:hypothetical protein